MTSELPPFLDLALLGELEARWRDQQAPIASHLRPGLSGSEIDELTAPLNLHLPDEARVWWQWHDGAYAAGGSSDRVIGSRGFDYLPLSEAVDKFHWARGIAESLAARERDATPSFLGEADYWWSRAWMPITQGSGGAILSCDCTVASGHITPMRSVGNWGGDPVTFERVRARSFGELVSWWVAAIDCGAWRYERRDGAWKYDWEMLTRELQLSHVV